MRVVLPLNRRSHMGRQRFAKAFIVTLIVISMGGWFYFLAKVTIWVIHAV